ncbi:MAG: hypothetical protein C4520_16785 [Candidatus Abyssobacteria bacterium SURF_5]|uniref:Pentapeptide repeat-containing protein n=1 Tax=Abyssobacteria bacterium (strain SURF_5) TaxID=2093360 RepID=A0A3A4NCV7_ABYX5|nr:MAG: hypothetical protein C4520_16785 [Candidatus Abyssubacteria bacterium SURF_5]
MSSKKCRYCRNAVPLSCLPQGEEPKDVCILHDPDARKDVAQFLALVHARLNSGNYNFSGFVFPEGASDFRGQNFGADADFSKAVFLGDASFRSTRFGGTSVDFSGAEFRGRADFSDSTFECGTLFFSHAIFSGSTAEFSRASFRSETTNFNGVSFEAAADFSGACFEGMGTYFTEGIFSGRRADFSRCYFDGEMTNFKWLQFLCDIDFSESRFTGREVNFQETRFSRGVARFEKACFLGNKTVFAECRFSGGGCSFSRAHFGGEEVVFHGTQFAGETASFSDAKCTCSKISFHPALFSAEQSDFSKMQFHLASADFRETVFSGASTTFAGAEFNGKAEFDGATFSMEYPPLFDDVQFCDSASFSKVRLDYGASFDGAKFLAEADFSHARFAGKSGRPISFQRARFSGACSFERVDLRHTLFGDFQMQSQFRADRAAWPSIRYFLYLRKRYTCADEIEARDPGAQRSAAAALEILEQAARTESNKRLANDFAFSAHECRRKARLLFSLRRYLELVFGAWLSGYGRKIGNIALSAVFIILIFAAIFFLVGEMTSAAAAGMGGNGEWAICRFAGCVAKSMYIFFSAGLTDLEAATKPGDLLVRLEGVIGFLIMSIFLFVVLRNRKT